MKISLNYRLLTSKITRVTTIQQSINTNNLSIQGQPLISEAQAQLTGGIKNLYKRVKNFILNQKQEDVIPPFPKFIKERAHRTTIKLTEIPEDRKQFEKNVRYWFTGSTGKKEEQMINMLITQKDVKGQYYFNDSIAIYSFIQKKNVSPGTLKKILDVCSIHPEKVSLYDLVKLNDNNFKVFKTLLTEKNSSNNKYLFFDSYWSCMLDSANAGNQDVLVTMIKAKDIQGNRRFDLSTLSYLEQYINSGNSRAIPYLLNARRSDGSLRFTSLQEWRVLHFINNDNIAAVPYLLNHTTKINGKTKHTLNAEEFYCVMREIKPDNIKTVPLLMAELSKVKHNRRGFLTAELVGSILKNLKNGYEKAVPEILKIKNPIKKQSYLFNSTEECEFVGEVAKAFCDKTLKGIAKRLLKKTPFTYDTAVRRYSSANGIYEYAKMLRDRTYKKQRKFLAKFYDRGWIPHFRDMKEIVELSKALAEAPNKDVIRQIISLKDPYSKQYIYSGFPQDTAIKTLDKINISLIQELLKVTNGAESHSVLTFDAIMKLINKYKRLTQIPVPKLLPRDDKNSLSILECVDLIDKYKKGTLDINALTSLQKFDFKSYLTALSQHPLKENTKYQFNLANLKKELNRHINQTIIPTETSAINKIALFRNVLSNNPDVEKLIGTFNFEQYAKKGLPLGYPRTQFLADLKEVLNSASDAIRKHVLKKLQIQPDIAFTSYEGILNIADLNKASKIEQKVYDICKRFIYQNKVNTGDMNFDNFLNSLIKGMPEFINIIGKQAHGAHDYSIDIHILQVLKNCIINENYKTLKDIDKTRLKIAVLMHDIAKKEGVVDKGHQELSALYARNILSKYTLPQSLKDDIYFLIQNHHWLQELNDSFIPIESVACNFRNPNDFLISKIFTYADLKSVSPEIFNKFVKDLDGAKAKNLQEIIQKIKENGNILFTDKIIDARKIPTVEYKNKRYKVINIPKLSSNQDLGEIGFFPGTKKDNLRFLVHTVQDSESLHRVEDLSDVSQDGVLSLSYISPNKNSAYCNNKFGVVLDENIPDIVNATPRNQGSGYAKDKSSLVSLKSHRYYRDSREFLPKIIRKALNLDRHEYQSLYDQLSQKKYITQIKDDSIFKLSSGKMLNGKEIKDAIIAAEKQLLKSNISEHNEVVGSYLKVTGLSAKVNDIKQIPQEYLDFVQEYNIPIYILGK